MFPWPGADKDHWAQCQTRCLEPVCSESQKLRIVGENLGCFDIPIQWGFELRVLGLDFPCDISCLLLNVMVTLVLRFDMMRDWYPAILLASPKKEAGV